jgi:BirA family transcriptional regulator, biotin operon repressor / biotin---[acetyl-CoA-carboxylase] ligase
MNARFSSKTLRDALTTRFVGRRLEYRAVLGSTQDLARRLAQAGAAEGTVVLAGRQTAGRGRLGRSFISPRGGLYFTVVLRPVLEQLRPLPIVAALAVARGLERVAGLRTALKWPNDVLVGGRKICGILVESELMGQAVSYALVGIGVNVNADMAAYPEIAAIATSVTAEAGRPVSREALAAAVLSELEALYLAVQSGRRVQDEWRARLETLGRQVRVTSGQTVEEGLAEDVDGDGSLILLRPDGSRVSIAAGDVTLREG